jgi:DNA-binding winged helix-turn-helix (wHTH) protein/tetratricopeptide (TPR) repeat protein
MRQLWEFDGYRLDGDRRVLLKGTDVVQLPSRAFDILMVLVQRRGEVVSKEALMQAVWPDSFVEESNLTQNVHLVRRALGEKPQQNRYIATVPTRGYSFVADVRQVTNGEDSPPEPEPPPVPPPPRREPWWRLLVDRAKGIFRWIGTSITARKGWIELAVAVIMALAAALIGLPSLARFYNIQGVALQEDGQIKQAIESYQSALRLRPGYAEAHYNLADAYEDLPAYDKALQEYQKAIEADPTLYPAYNNLARLYIKRLKDQGAALELLQRAFNLNPQEPSVQYSLYKNDGWANLELQLWGQAETNLRRAMALDPSRGAAHCLLAKVLDVQESRENAFKQWEICLADSNQSEVEPEWRAVALERVNNNKEAQK